MSSLLGRAVGHSRSFVNAIPTIGLSYWGAVQDRGYLVSPDGLFPASYYSSSQTEKERPLEPNHTHFLLLDRGTQHTFSKSAMVRKRIEVELFLVNATNAQLISVMIGGDLTSLKEVRRRLEVLKPVIVMKGTGRMADIICLALERANQGRHGSAQTGDKMVLQVKNAVLRALMTSFPSKSASYFSEHLKDLDYILSNRDHVTICCPGEEDVDMVILSALISNMSALSSYTTLDASQMAFEQLKLAIHWNRFALFQPSFTNRPCLLAFLQVLMNVYCVYHLNL